MNQAFAPGCALMLYKPHLADKVQNLLTQDGGSIQRHLNCCRHLPDLPPGTQIVNVCPGCDRRFRQLYEGLTTVSLWECLAASETFPFPDHGGRIMAIQDACPTRDQPRVQDAVRKLLKKMNINLVEPEATAGKAICCGDSLYGTLPVSQVKAAMARRAAQMPAEEVVVYCVSCIKSMQIGGKTPRYLLDLLFDESTLPGLADPDAWHAELDRFIGAH